MDMSVFVLIAFVVFAIGGLMHSNATQRWRAVLKEIGAHYGLAYQPAGKLGSGRHARRPLVLDGSFRKHPDRVAGEVDGFEVIVDSFTSSSGDSSTTYSRVRVLSDLPLHVQLTQESVGSFFGKAFRGPDVVVGDEAFDAEAYIRGDEVEIVARMNAPAREAARRLLRLGTTVSEGALTHQRQRRYKRAADAFVAVDALLGFARAARRDRPLPTLLADNVVGDPVAGVRVRNLELLAERYPEDPETARAVRAGLADRDLHVCLTAALVAGEPSHLEALLVNADLPTDVRLTAAGRLAELAPARASLAEHAAWIVDQLGASEAVALLAARALEHFGDIGAVEALLPHTRGVLKDGRLKEAARVAIAAIQARAPGDAGGLSLVDAAADAAGALSLTPEGPS